MTDHICETPGCGEDCHGNFPICIRCYKRSRYAGHRVTAPSVRSMSLAQRWRHYAVPGGTPQECWDWTGPTRSGRPFIKFLGQEISASRLAWYAVKNEWPDASIGKHCRNRMCTNPRHMYPRVSYPYVPPQRRPWDDASNEEL